MRDAVLTGLVAANGCAVIHAHMAHRKVVEERLTDQAPIVAAYRLPGIED